jgi:hypothetical protein
MSDNIYIIRGSSPWQHICSISAHHNEQSRNDENNSTKGKQENRHDLPAEVPY